MPWTFPQLKTAIQELTPAVVDNTAAHAAINAQTVEIIIDTPVMEILAILSPFEIGYVQWLAQHQPTPPTPASAAAATALLLLTSNLAEVATSNAIVAAKLDAALAALSSDTSVNAGVPTISPTSVDLIQALRIERIPIWDPTPSLEDVVAAMES